MPLVSVIVPCFDAGPLLGLTLASIAQQSHDDWEAIVVNDGSRDPATLEELARARSPGVRVVDQPNTGLASARNRGAAEAKGAYIQFLDADDLLLPSKLASQVAILEADPGIDAAVCGYQLTDASGQKRRSLEGSRHRIQEPALEDILFRWERGLSIPIHCALLRADRWKGTPPFEAGLRAKEDWLFWTMMALDGRRITFQDDPLVLYRIHDRNMCRAPAGMAIALAEVALVIQDRIPAGLRPRFREETGRHLRTVYAPQIDGTFGGAPLRHRAVDRLYDAVRRVPFMSRISRSLKKVFDGGA